MFIYNKNLTIIGDLNTETNQKYMKRIYETYSLTNFIKNTACFKNLEDPSCIDPILTDNPHSFQNSCLIKNGLSDFHVMAMTIMK